MINNLNLVVKETPYTLFHTAYEYFPLHKWNHSLPIFLYLTFLT